MRPTLAILAATAPTILAQTPDSCSNLVLIYARATTEPPQVSMDKFDTAAASTKTKGYGAAGYGLLMNMTLYVPGSTGYPVHYPASMGTENQGGADIVKHLSERSKACPEQKFALGGHSQGSFAVNAAIPKLSKEILERIVAVTAFGGLACLDAVKDRCISYCNAGDPVCSSRPCGLPPKVNFVNRNIEAKMPDCAVTWSMKTCGLGSGSHLGYNSDGVYVRAASCFIAAQYQKRAGGAL